jgi:hypothetical protein
MLHASKCMGSNLHQRTELAAPPKQYTGEESVISRSTFGRHYESPMAMTK